MILCTGFRFDDTVFDATCRPTLAINDRFPAQTSEWESTNVPGMYFAGTLMQMRDFKKKQSGFIHGFRYNIELLARIFERKYHHRELAFTEVDRSAEAIAEQMLARVNRSSALWQQTGLICDAVVVPRDGSSARYYEDLSVDYSRDAVVGDDDCFLLTMDFGQERVDACGDVFAIPRIRRDDVNRAAMSTAIHPIVRRYAGGRQTSEHDVIESLSSQWTADIHRLPLIEYLRRELKESTRAKRNYESRPRMEVCVNASTR